MAKEITGRQFLHIMEHNKCFDDNAWRKVGRNLFIVERLFYSDGTSEKTFTHITDPTIKFHLTKPEFALSKPQFSVPLEWCDEVEVPINSLNRFVAKETGQLEFLQYAEGQERKRVLLHNDVHGADVNLSDHYIARYMQEHGDMVVTDKEITTGYFDIEVDGADLDDFPFEDVAPAPVNLINYFDSETQELYVFLDPKTQNGDYYHTDSERIVNDPEFRSEVIGKMFLYTNWPSFRDLKWLTLEEDQELPTLEQLYECNERLMSEYPDLDSRDKFIKEKLRCHKIRMAITKGELDLIRKALHFIVNVRKPDVVCAWNMRFDVVTLMNRIIRLGYNPEDFFTPKDFGGYGQVRYDTDTFNDKATDSKDMFHCIGYSAWIDQMLTFAALRKGGGVRPSYALDNILSDELKEHKFSLKDSGSIKDAPYVNYVNFLIYGALDVTPMYALEMANGDLDQIYRISLMTHTRIHKNMTKTAILRNFAASYYLKQGMVLSTNRNMLNRRDPNKEKFLGAIVADPGLMEYVGACIDGLRSNRVFENAIDFDASAMYPSIDRASNIDPEALIGTMYLIDEADPNETPKRFNNFAQDWVTGDMYIIGQKHFGLMNILEANAFVNSLQ